MNFGFWELTVILLIVLLLFGARKLPDLARSLGKSIGEFKRGREESEHPEKKPDQDDASKSPK